VLARGFLRDDVAFGLLHRKLEGHEQLDRRHLQSSEFPDALHEVLRHRDGLRIELFADVAFDAIWLTRSRSPGRGPKASRLSA
jgi:hypothetical protein